MTLTKIRLRIGSAFRIVSFVLCVLFSLLWVRSCHTSDLITRTTAVHYHELATIPASLRLAISPPLAPPKPLEWTAGPIMPKPGIPQPLFVQQPINRNWYYFGVGIKRGTLPYPYMMRNSRRTIAYTLVSIPIQLIAFLCFLPTAWRVATIGRRRRLREARIADLKCPNCGYDLRATPDRCPECGQPSNATIAAAADSISIPR